MGPTHTQQLTPILFDADDSPDYTTCKNILHSLISQTTTPVQAAASLDEWVTHGAHERLERTRDRNLAQDAMDGNVYLVWPHPDRYLLILFSSLAQLCSAWPPSHPSQVALVNLIRELKALPKHQLPCISYDESHQPYLANNYTIWNLGYDVEDKKHDLHYSQEFVEEADQMAHPSSGVETIGSETQIRWRNIQSFMARLTIDGLIDCSHASALRSLAQSSQATADRQDVMINRITANLLASEPWIGTDTDCKWVLDRCRAGGHKVFNRDNWEHWKKQLEFVSNDGRFYDYVTALAASLRKRMMVIDNKGP